MGIYSSTYLKNLAATKQKLFETKMFNARNVPITTKFDIFLSHSFLDREEVKVLS